MGCKALSLNPSLQHQKSNTQPVPARTIFWSLWVMKEDISFPITALEKHLFNWSLQLQRCDKIWWPINAAFNMLSPDALHHSTNRTDHLRRSNIEFYAAAGKNCSWTSNFQPGMHPATEFRNLGHPQTHPRITDCKYLRPSRHAFLLILSEIKVQTQLQNDDLWQPRLISKSSSDFCKITVQIQFSLKRPWVILGPT